MKISTICVNNRYLLSVSAAECLPIFFINMEGEMMYILEQRLTAQNIPGVKAQKVLNDIIATMVNEDFVKELFRPQELYSKGALKTTFDKLAHASIMKLNTSSVDKLYDLISMAFKYQLYMCPRPSDLLLVTLNHIDALKRMANLQHIKNQVDNLYYLLIKTYMGNSESEFQQIRYTLLNFFQDIHIRVSMFIRDQSQDAAGRFAIPVSGPIPVDTEIPGSIRLFNSNGDMFRIRHFQNGGHYQPPPKAVTITLTGDRGTTLGTNLYNSPKSDENCPSTVTPASSDAQLLEAPPTSENSTAATEELNFLAQLIGNNGPPPQKPEFRLQLFDTPSARESSNIATDNLNMKDTVIVSPAQDNEELCKIMEDLKMNDVNSEARSDDLLDLMDSTCNQ